MADNVPEGYKAHSAKAGIYAVSSDTLAKDLQIHGTYQDFWSDEKYLSGIEKGALDPFVEYDFSNDVDFEELRQRAKGYAKRFSDEHAEEYIADTQEREKKITLLILSDLKEKYGDIDHSFGKSEAELEATYGNTPYNLNLGPLGKYTAEIPNAAVGTDQVKLYEMLENELKPRHITPLLSVLLHDAEVPNHLVNDVAHEVKNDNGYLMIGNVSVHHNRMFIVTDKGNALIDPTYSGTETESVYQPIQNSVTVDDVVYRGRSFITSDSLKENGLVYGGHSGTGDIQTSYDAVKLELERFNFDTPRNTSSHATGITLKQLDVNQDQKLTTAEIAAATNGDQAAAKRIADFLANFRETPLNDKGEINILQVPPTPVAIPKSVYDFRTPER